MCPGFALLGCALLGCAFVRKAQAHGSTIVQSGRRDMSIGIYRKARVSCKQEMQKLVHL